MALTGLINCIQQVACNFNANNPLGSIVKPIDSPVISPFVKLIVYSDNDKYITVGNQSNPKENEAVIKSFSFGQSDTFSGSIEIWDQQGGNFFKLYERIKNRLENSSFQFCFFQWGWIDGVTQKIAKKDDVDQISPQYTGIIQKMDVVFSGPNIVKFTIKIQHQAFFLKFTREKEVYGDEKNKVLLKQAIKTLLEQANPPIYNINYIRRIPGQVETTWNFKPNNCTVDTCGPNGQTDGPLGYYSSKGRDPLEIIEEWTKTVKTDQNKGFKIFTSGLAPGQINLLDPIKNLSLTFLEDVEGAPAVDPPVNCNTYNLGTFIVNGGKYSNVIDFSPKVDWNFAALGNSGGGNSGAFPGSNIQNKGNNPDCFGDKKGGTTTKITITNVISYIYGGQALQDLKKALYLNEFANRFYQPVEAELKVQGMPTLVDPRLALPNRLSLIVINPYSITKNNDDVYGWLQLDTCNSVFTDTQWQIIGLYHDINDNKYTTTIKIRLFAKCNTAV